MKLSRAVSLVSLLVTIASAAAAQKDLRQIVEEMNLKQTQAFMKGDMLGVARIYADDATIYFPDYNAKRGRSIKGREAIDRYWLGLGKPIAWKLEIAQVGGTDDMIWEIGRSTLTEERNGTESTYTGDFVVIWKRQKNGAYQIHADFYN